MTTAQELIGRTLQGKFVITDVLGEGAMGVVYRGFDDTTLDEVAIKVLQPGLAGNAELVSRFHREAAATRRVDHEGTVRVLGRGCEAGLYFLVMELLHGTSLAAVLTEAQRVSEGRAARLVIQLCGALAVAHARGVVHRDVKPENIMVIEGGAGLGERVKLLDFGIAKRMTSPDAQLPSTVEDSFTAGDETRAGALIGTPEYMAPEQCMGRDVDARTDLYACGVLLYRMVTGQVPFDGRDVHPFELCQRHIGEDPTPPREICSWISEAMEAIILKALSKAPDARYQSAKELETALGVVLAGIEHIEMERTLPLSLDLLGLGDEASALAEDLAAPVAIREAPEASLPSIAADVGGEEGEDVEAYPIVALPVVPRAPFAIEDPATEITKARSARRARVHPYLPTIAVAAVIGAGLGSLLMALAPFVR
jgi:serine/threonine protein kinase